MVLPDTDLSLGLIQSEFGGTTPISFAEYYAGGFYVPSGMSQSGIPTGGMIMFSNFLGKSNTVLRGNLIRRYFTTTDTNIQSDTSTMDTGFNNTSSNGGFIHTSNFSLPAAFNFAMEYTGWLTVETTGPYTFGLRSDDGSDFAMWIGNAWSIVSYAYGTKGVDSTPPNPGTRNLTAGVAYPIRIRFTQGNGAQELNLDWKPLSATTFTNIPFTVFSCNLATPITTTTIMQGGFPSPRFIVIPVVYYDASDSWSTTATDKSENGLLLTVSGGGSFSRYTAPFSGYFNNTSTFAQSVSTAPDFSNGWSVELLINVNTSIQTGWGAGICGTPFGNFQLNSHTASTTNLYFYNGTSNFYNINLSFNKWYHLVMCQNGSYYINTVSFTTTSPGSYGSPVGRFSIGFNNTVSNLSSAAGYQVGLFRVYNININASQVSTNYNAILSTGSSYGFQGIYTHSLNIHENDAWSTRIFKTDANYDKSIDKILTLNAFNLNNTSYVTYTSDWYLDDNKRHISHTTRTPGTNFNWSTYNFMFNVTIPYSVHVFTVSTLDYSNNYFTIVMANNGFSTNKLDLIRKSSFFIIGKSPKLVYSSDGVFNGDNNKRQIVFTNNQFTTGAWTTFDMRVYTAWPEPWIGSGAVVNFDASTLSSTYVIDSEIGSWTNIGSLTTSATGNGTIKPRLRQLGKNYHVQFDRDNNNHFSLSSFAFDWLNVGGVYNGFTIFVVAQFTNGAGAFERFMDFGNGSANNNIWFGRQGTQISLGAGLFNGSSEIMNMQTSFTENGGFHIFTMHVTNTSSGGTISLYCDSVTVASSTQNFGTPLTNRASTQNYIGRSNWWQDSYLSANMRQFLIYNTALSQADLSKVYSELKTKWGLL
jgi:hypothetical protein